MSGKVICVEGVIGCGKSSAATELSEILGSGSLLLLEPDEKDNVNPYLTRYYEDPKRWAFVMQIHLLSLRYKMHLQAQWFSLNTPHNAVIDRSLMGDTAFSRLQVKMGYMTTEEFDTYRGIYHAMTASVLLPNFCVHLVASPETVQKRIAKRMSDRAGRECESAVTLEYLVNLDHEISQMVAILERQGVNIIRLSWEEDRTKEQRAGILEDLAQQILATQPPDLFLDLHRRTI